MINKNKFSIKDTKKVLHKVGKKWVVVSAVLLGLVAGGAAVTTTNNASANTSVGVEAPAQNPTNMKAAAKAKAQNWLANHHLPTNSAAAENDFTKYADVNHLADVASVARANTTKSNNASNAYANLVDLADNPGKFASPNGNVKVGSDSANNAGDNTAFSMFNQASNDVNAINGGKDKNAKVSKAANAFSKAASYANKTISSAITVTSNSTFSMLGGISASGTKVINLQSKVNEINQSLTSVNQDVSGLNDLISNPSDKLPTIDSLPSMNLNFKNSASSINFSSTISSSVNVASLINSGYPNDGTSNIPSDIESLITSAAVNASKNLNSQASVMASAFSKNINSQINSNSTNIQSKFATFNKSVNDLVSKAKSYVSTYSSNKAVTQGTLQIDKTKIINDGQKLYNDTKILRNNAKNAQLAHGTTKTNAIAALPSDHTTVNHDVLTLTNDKNNAKNDAQIYAAKMIQSKLTSMYALQQVLTQKESIINSTIGTIKPKINSGIQNAEQNTIPNDIRTALGLTSSSEAATTGKAAQGLVPKYINEFVTPLKNASVNNVGPFKNDTITLGSLATSLSSSEHAIDGIASMAASLKGQTVSPQSMAKINTDIAKVVGKLNQANSALNKFNEPGFAPESADYKNVVSAAATLAGSYNYSTQYPAYSNIASYTNDFMNNLNGTSEFAAKFHSYIPHYPAISNYINSDIYDEANNTATSMYNTSNAMQQDVNGINTKIGSIESQSGKVSQGSYNSAIAKAISDSNAASSDLSNYYNSLSNGSTSSADANAKLNDANSISLSASSSATSSSSSNNNSSASTNGGNSGYIPSFVIPSTPTNNTNYNVEPTNTNTVEPEVTPKHAANYAKVIKALQLHTNPNFTSKNAVAVVKPGSAFWIEKSVKDHTGALRYEVKYNKKNYYITANKHFVNAYYKAAKHNNYNVKNYVHYRYAKVTKALQLHTNARFTKRNGVKVVRPGTEFHITNIVKNHGLVRYAVRYQGHNYFITANHAYTVNAYVQNYNYNKHGYKGVRVVKPINEYRKLNFAKRSLIRHVYRGSVLPVKKVVTIAGGEMTRLQLTNGHYVTANKDFVEPIR